MAHRLVVAPDATWLPTHQMAQHLSISRATLQRLLKLDLFVEGRHYRRANPTCANSNRLWHRQRVCKALGAE